MTNKMKLIELAGWYGTVAILLAYALNSFRVLDADNLAFQLLNLSGAIGIVVISYIKGAKQPAVLNAVWSAIALIAIVQIILG